MFSTFFMITEPQTSSTKMIEHVINSIHSASNLNSQLTSRILSMSGMSSPKVRHLLNNICSLPGTNYLEIGVWKGSTFISALYNNQTCIESATAIDNWSEFGGPKAEFIKNTKNFINNINFNFFEHDSFSINLDLIPKKINVFFYDGFHTAEAQKKAFTYYNPIFEDIFIAIVDDYNLKEVQTGTQDAFKELGYTVLFETQLKSFRADDNNEWWNGLYIAVISKNNS